MITKLNESTTKDRFNEYKNSWIRIVLIENEKFRYQVRRF